MIVQRYVIVILGCLIPCYYRTLLMMIVVIVAVAVVVVLFLFLIEQSCAKKFVDESLNTC